MTPAKALAIFGAKYLLVIIVGIALIYFLRQPRPTQRKMLTLAAVACPLILLIARLIAIFYYDPRPFVVGHFAPLIPHDPDNGFPSDHALLGAAISSWAFPFSKKLSAAAWILTLLVGFSRVYVGVHHPIDIAGSIIISILTTSAVYRGLNLRSAPEREIF